MTTHAKEPLGWDDYRATPATWPYYELIEGQLVKSVSPGTRHQQILLNVMALVHGCARSAGLGYVVHGPLAVFLSPHDVLHPDLIFVSEGRREILVDEGIHGPPDLVVEITIPATAERDRNQKREIYARCGVKELWLVDPVLEQIHRYDFAVDAGRPVRVVDSEEAFQTPLLPGLVIEAIELFRR